jgi:hypothetical protein
MNWDWLIALTSGRKHGRTAKRVGSDPPVKPGDDVGGGMSGGDRTFSNKQSALRERESARRLARLGGSEPQLKPIPRRRP